MWPLSQRTFSTPALAWLARASVEHLVGHVEPVGDAGGADAAGGEQHVDAAAGAEVEHGLALVQVGHRGRDAAAERGQQRGVGQLVLLAVGVEAGAEELGLLVGDHCGVRPQQPAAAVGSVVASAAAA